MVYCIYLHVGPTDQKPQTTTVQDGEFINSELNRIPNYGVHIDIWHQGDDSTLNTRKAV